MKTLDDTSYLEKPELEPVPDEESWYDYDNQKALFKCQVGEKILYRGDVLFVVAHHFKREEILICSAKEEYGILKYINFIYSKPLDYDRKAIAERKKVVDAIVGVNFDGYVMTKVTAQAIYDKGFLKLPESEGE